MNEIIKDDNMAFKGPLMADENMNKNKDINIFE